MSDLPGLIVDVEARIDKLEKGLKRANAAQNRASNQMEARAKQSANRLRDTYGKAGDSILATFKRLGPGLAGGLVGGLTVGALSGLSGNLGRIVNDVASIGDEAKRAGVSVQALQEWKFVGAQNRIGIDQVVDGLKELNLRADEFIITKTGPAAEAFQRLGISANELKTKLKDPSELLLEIIGRMEGLDQAARIRISDELFGGSAGERFAELVGRGEAKLRDTIRAANDTGAVLDQELIEKAAELDRRFAALKSRADAFLKGLVVGIADAAPKVLELGAYLDNLFDGNPNQARALLGESIASTLSRDARAVEDNRAALEALASVYDETSYYAERNADRIARVAEQLRAMGQTDAVDTLDRVAGGMRTLTGELEAGTISADEFESRLAAAADTANEVMREVAAINGTKFDFVIGGLGRLVSALATAAAKARELRASLPGGSADGSTDDATYDDPGPKSRRGHRAATPGLAVTNSIRPQLPSIDASFGSPEPDAGGGGKGAGGGGTARQNDLQREIESIAQETAALRLEAQALAEVAGARMAQGDAIEFARTRAELLAAAQRAGQQITPQLTAQIDTLAREYVEAGAAAELAAAKIQDVQNASRAGAERIAGVFEQMATGAMTAKQAVGQLILELIRMSLQKRLLEAAEGAGGSVFGTILKVLGGGFAEGGYTGHGGKYQPAGVVHKGEYVMSKAATSALGVANLDSLHQSALRGYSGGGLVGAARVSSALPLARSGAAAPSIEINAPVTVNASGGTPEQNNDLAKQMAREMEQSMRNVVVSEISRQMRPGALLSRKR
ncbi:phage tail tape measure protein [Sulfitobacter sp. 1A13421]|uniref:phage tail tape measure protein n=1 Tax=Sulfitobacter sp. 1A13421 TaxID=3368595 RepID=UPI0037460CF4